MIVKIVLYMLIGTFVVGPTVGWILGRGLELIGVLWELLFPPAPARPAELKLSAARYLRASELLESSLKEKEEHYWRHGGRR